MNDTPNSSEVSQTTQPPQATKTRMPLFEGEIGKFAHDVESLEATLPEVMRFLNSVVKERDKKHKSFLESKAIEKIQGEKGIRWKLPQDARLKSLTLRKRCTMAMRAEKLVPMSFIVTLISQFDSFLGRIIRLMYLANPDLLNASERSITLTQLLQIGSIEEAREKIVEKEVETVLRDSHAEQFKWLEKKMDMPLKKDLIVWSSFIELTERRNLFVHCDGRVSDQYLKVCKENGYKFEALCETGKLLGVNSEYFTKACDVVYEIGVKLGHVLWLKLIPAERNAAERHINNLCLDLISRDKYELSIMLLDFALRTLLRKESSAKIRWMLTVNMAQAHKWNGAENECQTIINRHDWDVLAYQFRLAKAVLEDDYKVAIELMKKIGPEGDVEKELYREWPLFRRLRLQNDFLVTFKEIFREPFEQDVTVPNEIVAAEESTPKSPPINSSQTIGHANE